MQMLWSKSIVTLDKTTSLHWNWCEHFDCV